MFAKLLVIPFLLLALLGLYLSWSYVEGWTWLIVVGVLSAAVVYILSPQLNWWYYQRHPKDIDPELRTLLERHDPYYRALSPVHKQRFRERMALFFLGTEFMPQGWESVPHDVEGLVAAAATKVRFTQEKAIFRETQRIIVYPTPFPSPAWPEHWHSTEWFAEDGVLLFSARELVWGMMHPGQRLDLALYEYIRVLRAEAPELPWPARPEGLEAYIYAVSGWTPEDLATWTGLPVADLEAVWASLWFTHPDRMARVEGEWMEAYAAIFGSLDWRAPVSPEA